MVSSSRSVPTSRTSSPDEADARSWPKRPFATPQRGRFTGFRTRDGATRWVAKDGR